MQVDFTPVDSWQRPSPARTVPADFPPSGEEPRTAGMYRIEGRGIFTRQAAPMALAPDAAAPSRAAPSFGDFLDMINPLQHIPLVNIAYRSLTGDEIGPAAQIVGGALFGGPIGAVAGTASAIIEYQTGQSVTGAALSALSGKSLAKTPYQQAQNGPVIKRYNFNQST